MKRASIEDVAKLACVSISTVSRVVNNTGYPVSEKAKRQVLNAVKQLGFIPNLSAQNLRQNFNNIIGLITRDIADPYFGLIARGVTERTNYYGILSFVANTGRNPKNELQYHDLLWQHKVRGVILAGGAYNATYRARIIDQLKRYKGNGTKVIALAPQGFQMQYLMIDNRLAGEMITDYLINAGHKKIAFINGPETHYTASARLEGYKISLKKHDLPLDESLIVCNEFSWKGGYEATKTLLNRKIEFSGISCANDNIAFGSMRALAESGISIPGEMSMIGIGDVPMTACSSPSLTTVQVPFYEMGARAVDIIMSDAPDDEVSDLIFKTKIIERESVRKI